MRRMNLVRNSGRVVLFMLFLIMNLPLAFAGHNGKGKGGGSKKQDTIAARFSVVSPDLDLVDDGSPLYVDGQNGVEAFYFDTGNPTLRLQESTRLVILDLSGCEAYIDDSDTSQVLSQIMVQAGIVNYGVMIDEYGSSVDPAFFGLGSQIGFSDLALSFDDPFGAPWRWSIRFDPDFGHGATQSQVTRLRDSSDPSEVSEVSWEVSTVGATAVVLRKALKGRPHFETAAVCEPLEVRYVVSCDLDGDGSCDLR